MLLSCYTKNNMKTKVKKYDSLDVICVHLKKKKKKKLQEKTHELFPGQNNQTPHVNDQIYQHLRSDLQ